MTLCFCLAYISTNQIMGWGNKAIEIRNVDTGHLDGVFMHKKAQRLKFLCNSKSSLVRFRFCGADGGWSKSGTVECRQRKL